jgi:3-oxoacyl-[acyl-carrier protein] reductase
MRPGTEQVAIVTGAASGVGREIALGVASWGAAIVVVYLDLQRSAEATVAEILAAGGTTVAVRADLTDELDVDRLFGESIAAFGGVDAVVHSTTDRAALLYRQAARHLRQGGAIVSVAGTDPLAPGIARQLRERGFTIARARPDAVLALLHRWGDARGI